MQQNQFVDNGTSQELSQSLRRLVLLWRGHDIALIIEDVIKFKYNKTPIPRIFKKFKLTKTAWEFLIKLPAGYAYKDFKAMETLFSDAVGDGAVQISRHGKVIKMCVSTERLKDYYPYKFDPTLYPKMYLPIHCGYTAIGEIVKDLSSMVNVLCAGHPGSGKSTWIHSIAMNLIHNNMVNPKGLVNLVVIDLKLMEFKYLEKHALIVTQKEDITNLLQSCNREMDRKLAILSKARCVRIQDYIKKGNSMPFTVVIVDELTEISDNEEAQILLNRIARLGRAAGCLLVFSTQRPSAQTFANFTETRAQFQASMCFHVRDAMNSMIVLGNELASQIPNKPGRAIFQYDDQLETQTMCLPTDDPDRMEELLDAISPPIVQNIPFYTSFKSTRTAELPVRKKK